MMFKGIVAKIKCIFGRKYPVKHSEPLDVVFTDPVKPKSKKSAKNATYARINLMGMQTYFIVRIVDIIFVLNTGYLKNIVVRETQKHLPAVS